MNEVDAGRDRATRHRLDMMPTSLSPLSLHATLREPLGLLTGGRRGKRSFKCDMLSVSAHDGLNRAQGGAQRRREVEMRHVDLVRT
jgi:hypothetical protein